MSNITKTPLSETQQAILALIAERVEADGLPPSQAEIAIQLAQDLRGVQRVDAAELRVR